MNRILRGLSFVLAIASPLSAQQQPKPVLAVSCTADKVTLAQGDSINLTIGIENRGSSDVYIYRTLEWGWAGIGFTLTNEKGDVARPEKQTVPLPPPPVYDKSQLVGLAPGYFFGTRIVFDLSHYSLNPGVLSSRFHTRAITARSKDLVCRF